MAAKIMVYGVTGSGKTTLARQISEKTGIPWYSIDDLTWEPNWVTVALDIQKARVQAICDQPAWIIDACYASWKEIPLAQVELIVALDYPRWFSLFRLIRRVIVRIIDKKAICNGNRETLLNSLSSKSVVAWHFKSFNKKRMRIREWAAKTNGPKVLRFTRQSQVDAWLNTFERTSPT